MHYCIRSLPQPDSNVIIEESALLISLGLVIFAGLIMVRQNLKGLRCRRIFLYDQIDVFIVTDTRNSVGEARACFPPFLHKTISTVCVDASS